ncbi:hypothetical protein C8Q79DRAFT_933147 [Trametes meyenii]|nr:hypothetical protein C8Q79DRAFT_933147 [Trametes meyenii]
MPMHHTNDADDPSQPRHMARHACAPRCYTSRAAVPCAHAPAPTGRTEAHRPQHALCTALNSTNSDIQQLALTGHASSGGRPRAPEPRRHAISESGLQLCARSSLRC